MNKAFDKDMRHADWDKVFDRQRRRSELAQDWMDAIGLKPGDRILEVGCGPGYLSLVLADRVGPEGMVYAIDSSPDALAYLEQRQNERGIAQIRRIAADAATLDADLNADCAFATMVLHHVNDAAILLHNLNRLLRPGALVLVAEFHPDGPCEHGAPREFRIRPEQIQTWLEQADFVAAAYRRQTPEHYTVVARRKP